MRNVTSTSSPDALKVLCFNATSIRGKLHDFNSHFDHYSSDTDYDVIALTETWLDDSVHDEEILSNSRYNVFRKDRNIAVSKKRDGGGVLLAVNSKFLCKRRHDLETDIEIIWIECKIDNARKLFLVLCIFLRATICQLCRFLRNLWTECDILPVHPILSFLLVTLTCLMHSGPSMMTEAALLV